MSCLAYYDGIIIRFFDNKSPGRISENISGYNNQNKWTNLWYEKE
jgi:XTP/dITP diphosphohydrolase